MFVSIVYKNLSKIKNLAGWNLDNIHLIKNLFRLSKKKIGSFMRVFTVMAAFIPYFHEGKTRKANLR